MHFRVSTSKGRGHFNVSTALDQVTISTASERRLRCAAALLVAPGNVVLARLQLWDTDFTCCSFKWLFSVRHAGLAQASCLHVCHPTCFPTTCYSGYIPASVHTPVLRRLPVSRVAMPCRERALPDAVCWLCSCAVCMHVCTWSEAGPCNT